MSSCLRTCPLCQSNTPPEIAAHAGDYVLRRCTACSFVWSVELATGHHGAADYSTYGEEYLQRPAFENTKEWIKLSFLRRWEFGQIRASNRNRQPLLLDMGAGAGRFVAHCRKHGIQALGVEPSSILRDYAQRHLGVTLFPSLELLLEKHGAIRFDVVTSHDVVEHLSAFDLGDHLAQIRGVLRADGYLVGNTPNFSSLNLALNLANDPVISPPLHCLYFTPQSLELCLTNAGFAPLETVTSGLSAFFYPLAGGSLLKKLLVLAQKTVLGASWPIVRRFRPDWGYQILFAYRKV